MSVRTAVTGISGRFRAATGRLSRCADSLGQLLRHNETSSAAASLYPHAHARCVSFLVLSSAVISDLRIGAALLSSSCYTPLLERHWLELSGHRNQNSRRRADLVME